MFTPEDRARIHQHVLDIATRDDRVVAGAVVGSLALDDGDRYSDIDLSFAVRDDVPISEVLEDWTNAMADVGAVRLLDLVRAPIVYRVFLLPDCLQVDLSFSPASGFRPTGPRFRLLFGDAGEPLEPEAPSGDDLLGWAALYARDVRVSIPRGEVWRAENSLSALRHYALSFACSRRGLPSSFGKGHDQLPADVLESFAGSLAATVDPVELARALKSAITAVRAECARAEEVPPELDRYLGDLLEP